MLGLDSLFDLLQLAIKERAAIIRDRLPSDVRTILDVGCGVGLVTKSLARSHSVVGMDVSRDVHRGAAEPRVCGLSTSLPFRAGSFDLVLATQIVEHLTDDDLHGTMQESLRVSRRYILVTTTYRENLRAASVPCPSCGVIFNTYGHLRTFNERSLAAVLPECRVLLMRTYAKARSYPSFLVGIDQRLLGFWHYEIALLCTHCGNDRFPAPRRGLAHLSRVTSLLARILPRAKRPMRILMLFEKTG